MAAENNKNQNNKNHGRGFAGMSEQKRKEAARKGGQNSHGGGRTS